MTGTVDQLQKHLQKEIFHYAADSKKAAGRALGTIVEIVTYYKLCAWGFANNTLIEKPVPEFGRPDIRHNVEFSMHRVIGKNDIEFEINGRPITSKAISRLTNLPTTRTETLLSSKALLRNSSIVGEFGDHYRVASLAASDEGRVRFSLAEVELTPVAIFECKRVGVEEGMKKGPQSIEKAKQGAYVARSVSSLQKVIKHDGTVLGYLPESDRSVQLRNYDSVIFDILNGRIEVPSGFVLTVGVTSNHGNWFTAENANKEMKVLAAAYDWLLFFTDQGLMDFVNECVLEPKEQYSAIRAAFMGSYNGTKAGNQFTKTKLDLKADRALRLFFLSNSKRSDRWFNVISPTAASLGDLPIHLRQLLMRRETKQ